jgi:hypothetical protein
MHVLQVLYRRGVPAEDLITIYCIHYLNSINSGIRSEVWYNSKSLFERIQRRAMRIIFLGRPYYTEALHLAGYPKLDKRREDPALREDFISKYS